MNSHRKLIKSFLKRRKRKERGKTKESRKRRINQGKERRRLRRNWFMRRVRMILSSKERKAM
jgi:hypothetical protein